MTNTDDAEEKPPVSVDKSRIDILFTNLQTNIAYDLKYYKRYITVFLWGIRVILIIALGAFSVGLLAPFVGKLGFLTESSRALDVGYLALFAALLTLVVERVLLISKNWGRFTIARLQLENLSNRLHIERHALEASCSDDETNQEIWEEIIATLKRFEDQRAGIRLNEAREWIDALNKSLDYLNQRVTTASDQSGRDANKDSPRPRVQGQ